MGNIRIFNRFATRMIVAFVVAILFPAVFTSASFYLVSNSTVKNNVRESSVQIAQQAADSLSFILNAGSDVSDLIYSDLKIQNVVANSGGASQNLKAWRENERYLESFLNNIVYSSSFVNIVYVLKNQDESWGSGTFSRIKLSHYDLNALDWTREAKAKDGGLVWLGLQDDRFSGGGDSTELVLPIARIMKDFDTMKTIGYVLVNLNGRKILDNISRMKLGATGGFFVVNEEGRIMVDANHDRINKPVANAGLLAKITGDAAVEFEFDDDGVPSYGVKQRLANGWLIVGTVPIHEITDKLDTLHNHILLSFGAFTLIGILIGLAIAGRVTRPIKQLTRQMKLVQLGDLTARTHVLTHDEFGLMSRQFNRMIADVERLMAQVTREQRQKQDAELRAVAHRINPHFLFNTLGTLRWLIKYDQSASAYEGISALIRLLEANMGKKGNFVTVEEELDIIEKYLAILELRYSRRFRLNTQVDPAAAAFVIPRMMIQPLVENAVFHGIVPKDTGGEIAIEAKMSGEAVVITVKDDGIGLTPERARMIRSIRETVRAGQTGIGLRHVVESIELYFDRGSEATIGEAEGGGTVVRIVLYPKASGQEGEAHA
ncbi:cache domain-containing sensor histidine kinase [Cohnella nanjingensis]|uniref:Sensor histidine kinase n=1 Tax=Cohnella nanjingensis TaxID=1387779 RepID=A0A7X0RPU9_9BACL|nr:sensor histidine kinase [Cohnella nanjingensis]MBB6671331.1 sensor histidine kinase [Cohnella nanjingensis]